MSTKWTDTKRALSLYVVGYVLSLYLSLVAYVAVERHRLNKQTLIVGIVGCALVQFLVQLACFLHLNRLVSSRWRWLTLATITSMILLLVIGSLWIMANMNYRMSPEQMNRYMQSQDSL